ncbi:MAG: hypothetical protein Q9157_002773 [Trypethelium eluteriae]
MTTVTDALQLADDEIQAISVAVKNLQERAGQQEVSNSEQIPQEMDLVPTLCQDNDRDTLRGTLYSGKLSTHISDFWAADNSSPILNGLDTLYQPFPPSATISEALLHSSQQSSRADSACRFFSEAAMQENFGGLPPEYQTDPREYGMIQDQGTTSAHQHIHSDDRSSTETEPAILQSLDGGQSESDVYPCIDAENPDDQHFQGNFQPFDIVPSTFQGVAQPVPIEVLPAVAQPVQSDGQQAANDISIQLDAGPMPSLPTSDLSILPAWEEHKENSPLNWKDRWIENATGISALVRLANTAKPIYMFAQLPNPVLRILVSQRQLGGFFHEIDPIYPERVPGNTECPFSMYQLSPDNLFTILQEFQGQQVFGKVHINLNYQEDGESCVAFSVGLTDVRLQERIKHLAMFVSKLYPFNQLSLHYTEVSKQARDAAAYIIVKYHLEDVFAITALHRHRLLPEEYIPVSSWDVNHHDRFWTRPTSLIGLDRNTLDPIKFMVSDNGWVSIDHQYKNLTGPKEPPSQFWDELGECLKSWGAEKALGVQRIYDGRYIEYQEEDGELSVKLDHMELDRDHLEPTVWAVQQAQDGNLTYTEIMHCPKRDPNDPKTHVGSVP